MSDPGNSPENPLVVHPVGVQHAQLAVRIGERTRVSAAVTVTSAGLLSIGAMVSSILLSTAMVVRAARRAPPADGAAQERAGQDKRRRRDEKKRRKAAR